MGGQKTLRVRQTKSLSTSLREEVRGRGKLAREKVELLKQRGKPSRRRRKEKSS